jgi:hypothetical protein
MGRCLRALRNRVKSLSGQLRTDSRHQQSDPLGCDPLPEVGCALHLEWKEKRRFSASPIDLAILMPRGSGRQPTAG